MFRIAGCSTVEVMISVRDGSAARPGRSAVVFDSVPPEVKMTSWSCSAPIRAWTARRAAFTAPPTSAPKAWIEDALPNCSVKKGSMAATASGATRVVALLSR